MILYIYLHQPKPFQKRRVKTWKASFQRFGLLWLVPCHWFACGFNAFSEQHNASDHHFMTMWWRAMVNLVMVHWRRQDLWNLSNCRVNTSGNFAKKNWTHSVVKAVVRNVGEQRTLHKGNCKLLSGSNHQLHLVLFAPYFVSDWWKRNKYKHAYTQGSGKSPTVNQRKLYETKDTSIFHWLPWLWEDPGFYQRFFHLCPS